VTIRNTHINQHDQLSLDSEKLQLQHHVIITSG